MLRKHSQKDKKSNRTTTDGLCGILNIMKTLQVIVLGGKVACHVEKECSHLIEVHIEVAAEAYTVFVDSHVVPLQALECAVVIESSQFLRGGLMTHVCF